MGQKRKYPAISIHTTLNENLEVNWEREYDGSFQCPECKSNQFRFERQKSGCRLKLRCLNCSLYIPLTKPTGQHIFRYQPELTCPNPLCNKISPNGQTKGWVYLHDPKNQRYKCYYCGIFFKNLGQNSAWSAPSSEKSIKPFKYEDNLWDLRNFYQCSHNQTINFSSIKPSWYREQVKDYLHFLLKAQVYSSAMTIYMRSVTLKQFGEIIQQKPVLSLTDITRNVVLAFIDIYSQQSAFSLKDKLIHLRYFFEWLELDAQNLIRSRDFPKRRVSNPDWLDEKVRTTIKKYLSKIPAPIARQYQIQEYTAARPIDICQIGFDCLVEDNGKWYIRFYQQKVQRWHQLPVTRNIRSVIEEQQQWIRQTLGENYPYLFCHFRGIHKWSYPNFPGMKPLPEPPPVRSNCNQMVHIIRLLIEQENILDTNGQQPCFTGKITRPSRLQEVRTQYGMEAAKLYADHKKSATTFQYYAPPTREQVAEIDLPFQELLMNPDNKFLPWQSLPESLLKNPKAHELDLEIAPRLVF